MELHKDLTGRAELNTKALCICLMMLIVALLFIGMVVTNTWKLRLSTAESTIQTLQLKEQTLDLALEFGFDPMVVQTTQRLSTKAFHEKHDPITWRFVKTDKELAYLILSVIQTESHGDPAAKNKSGASGLTQMMFSTAKQYDKTLKPEELLTLPKNLEIAVTHFVDLLERYRGNHYLAVLAWNRGITGADRILAAGVGTDEYVTSVFTQAALRNAQ